MRFLVFAATSLAGFLSACAAVRADVLGRWADATGFGLLAVGLAAVAVLQLRGDGKR